MTPKPIAQSPKLTAESACCVLRGACPGGETRNTQHATTCRRRSTANRRRSRAFTLIEIMIVVSIMGLVMTMSVPIVYKLWRKAPMRQAVKDIVEVLSHARARAILHGQVTEVVFHPRQNQTRDLESLEAVRRAKWAAHRQSAAADVAPAAEGP